MPVYFGKPLSGYTKAPPEFAARRIDLQKSDVVSAGYRGLPYILSALYAAYIYFLPYFMKATVNRKKESVSRFFSGNYFSIKIGNLMEWPFPDLVVGALPSHDAEFTNLARDVEGIVISSNKTKVMSIPNVTPAVFLSVRGANVSWDASCDQGRSNLNDFLNFLHVLRVFTAFLLTHQYPHDHDAPTTNPHKRTKVEMYLGETNEMEEDEEIDEADPINDTSIHFDLIRKAKPSPANFPYSGSPNDVPFFPGILFPYFPGCILPSYTVIVSVIKTYFFSCLGDTEEECASVLRGLKKATASWAGSDSGLALQHLAMGIQLAIESESRLFIIKEGSNYLGFTLLGYGFSVTTSAGIQKALSAEDLKSEIQAMESRASVARNLRMKIVEIATEAGLTDGDLVGVPTEEEISLSVRGLRRWVISQGLLEGLDKEVLQQVEGMMRKVYQSEPFWKVNKANVCKAIVTILDDHPLSDEVPFFISPQVFSDVSKVHEVMAAFGATGFSFNMSGGTDYQIPLEGETDTASELVNIPAGKGRTRTEKAMPSIYLALKPMRSSVYDFTQVISGRKITQRRERAGAQKCIQLTGEDRDDVWDILKECLQAVDKRAETRKQKEIEGRPEPIYHAGLKRKARDDF